MPSRIIRRTVAGLIGLSPPRSSAARLMVTTKSSVMVCLALLWCASLKWASSAPLAGRPVSGGMGQDRFAIFIELAKFWSLVQHRV
jgi:hypothetical protein